MIRRVPELSAEAAEAVVDAAVDRARRIGVPVAVAVVDRAGELLAFLRMDGAPLLSVGVAQDKAWTVTAFGQPTRWWAELFAAQPELRALSAGRRLMPVPGGWPIEVDGEVAGAVGVSGGSAEEDEQIAREAAATVNDRGASSAG
jgi:uncharacterized protein GlcG (DUF336 family)